MQNVYGGRILCGNLVLIIVLIFPQIFINNEFVNSVSGKTFPTINPSTGKAIVDIQEGDKVRQTKLTYTVPAGQGQTMTSV